MTQDIIFKIFAHASLVTYIVVLVWLLFILRKMVRNQATQYIYAALYFWLLLATKDIAYMFGDVWYDKQVTNILISIDLWPTPIMAIMMLYALQPHWLNLKRVAAILTPFFIFTLLNIITKGDESVFLATQIYGYLFATVMGAIIFILTYKCNGYINANYSDKQHIDVKWVRYLIVVTYSICTLTFFTQVETTWLGDAIYYISTTVLTSMLFYFALHHREVVFPNYMKISTILGAPTEKYEDSIDPTIEACQYPEIEKKLDRAINMDKIYLNPQLSLTDLANKIGTNRTYLSRYINHYKDTPFINYINNFRCEEAQRLIQDHNCTLSLTEISEHSGFASYSTFRRVFKQKYGYAPSEHRG